jgi:hypothetical protein
MEDSRLARIKKVLIIRRTADNMSQEEVLLETPSIKLAKAALEDYFNFIFLADRMVAERKTMREHYPQMVRRHAAEEEGSEDYAEVWDLLVRPDVWFSGEERLVERIYVKVIRYEGGNE